MYLQLAIKLLRKKKELIVCACVWSSREVIRNLGEGEIVFVQLCPTGFL